MNLHNRIETLPTVQSNNESITTNGCKVSVVFRDSSDPKIEKDIA